MRPMSPQPHSLSLQEKGHFALKDRLTNGIWSLSPFGVLRGDLLHARAALTGRDLPPSSHPVGEK